MAGKKKRAVGNKRSKREGPWKNPPTSITKRAKPGSPEWDKEVDAYWEAKMNAKQRKKGG